MPPRVTNNISGKRSNLHAVTLAALAKGAIRVNTAQAIIDKLVLGRLICILGLRAAMGIDGAYAAIGWVGQGTYARD